MAELNRPDPWSVAKGITFSAGKCKMMYISKDHVNACAVGEGTVINGKGGRYGVDRDRRTSHKSNLNTPIRKALFKLNWLNRL